MPNSGVKIHHETTDVVKMLRCLLSVISIAFSLILPEDILSN